eukprot:scaffold91673_cov32-Tisochrysis_lutea.AAC.4
MRTRPHARAVRPRLSQRRYPALRLGLHWKRGMEGTELSWALELERWGGGSEGPNIIINTPKIWAVSH